MRTFLILTLSALAGCAGLKSFDEVSQEPSSQWTDEDCMTVILNSTSHNIFDQNTMVKTAATPFSPLVLRALARMDQQKQHLGMSEFEVNLQGKLLDELGLLYDTESKRYFNKDGSVLRGPEQMDSLIFFVDLVNTSNCEPLQGISSSEAVLSDGQVHQMAMMKSVLGNMPMSALPCETPDISHLQDQILLENDAGRLLKPNVVWGRRSNVLDREEILLVMFQLRWGDYHFLAGTKKVVLSIEGLGRKVQLEFPLSHLL